MANDLLLSKLNFYGIYISGQWFKSYHNDTKTENRDDLGFRLNNTRRLGLDIATERVALLYVWEFKSQNRDQLR
jgi:hypothetical protein